MLKQNLDFVAVAIIVLILGVMQAPRIGVRVARVAMEQQTVLRMRQVRLEPPAPPCPARVVKPVFFVR